MPLCEIKGLTKYFGGLAAVNKIDLEIDAGEILGIIGPNGAGKTTLLNLISGYHKPTAGAIIFKNENITGHKPHYICRKHIARTFQLTRILKKLTVLENVMVGALYQSKQIEGARTEAIKWLEFVSLGEKKHYPVESLTHADYRRLEIARALATQPELLLLDEPLAGLNPREVLEACDLVRKINMLGITSVMVEHVMKGVMSLSQRIFVINYGEKIAEGNPLQIATNEQVIKAYLGKVYVEGKKD